MTRGANGHRARKGWSIVIILQGSRIPDKWGGRICVFLNPGIVITPNIAASYHLNIWSITVEVSTFATSADDRSILLGLVARL